MPKKYPGYEAKRIPFVTSNGKIIDAEYAFGRSAGPDVVTVGVDNVEAMSHIDLHQVAETVRVCRVLGKQGLLDRFNGAGHEKRKFIAAYSGELTADISQSWLLAAVEALSKTPVQSGPVAYDELKWFVETFAQGFNKESFQAGTFNFDMVLQSAIDQNHVELMNGGYVITKAGKEESRAVHKRVMELAL